MLIIGIINCFIILIVNYYKLPVHTSKNSVSQSTITYLVLKLIRLFKKKRLKDVLIKDASQLMKACQ